MPKEKTKAVLFDIGETLLNFGKLDTARVLKEAARQTYDFLRQAHQPVTNFSYYCWRNLISIRLRYFFSNLIGRDFDSLTLIKKTGTKKGIRLTEQQWQHLAWLWYEPLSRVAHTEADIIQTLTKLKNLGLKLGIVSNTFVSDFAHDKHLAQLGILDFFSVRIYSYKFNFRKPDRRIFQIAAEQLGEQPQNIVFTGDRIGADIKGALNAGMQAVLKKAYTNNSKKIPSDVYKISNLAELPELIEKINAN